jgi:hypothetical protein
MYTSVNCNAPQSAFRSVLLVLFGQTLHAATQDAACSCGVTQPTKIVGGVNAKLNQYPWQVGFSLKNWL